MKFSIITVNYNNNLFLEKTILSVKSLLVDGFEVEYIIIDGGSTDGSIDTVLTYVSQGVINNYVSESDSGIYDAMNKGIKISSGDWLVFMNAGDLFASPDVLLSIYRVINEKTTTNLVYGDYISSKTLFNQHLSINFLMSHMLNHQSIFYKKTLFSNQCYNLKYRFCADYEHLINNLRIIDAQHVYKTICIYDDTGISSADKNKFIMWLERLNAIWKSPNNYGIKIRLSLRGILALPYQYFRYLINKWGLPLKCELFIGVCCTQADFIKNKNRIKKSIDNLACAFNYNCNVLIVIQNKSFSTISLRAEKYHIEVQYENELNVSNARNICIEKALHYNSKYTLFHDASIYWSKNAANFINFNKGNTPKVNVIFNNNLDNIDLNYLNSSIKK
nr:glycosyltransferase family 2 protein [Providencia rettgeri]